MNNNTTPPVADVRPHELQIHGHTRIDPYYWLREKDNPDVLAYLEAENNYMKAVMAHTESLQQKLYEEMVGRIQETDSTVPVKKGNNYYYMRTEAGKQYKIHCRKQDSLDAEEEILLDENELAAGQPYFKVGIYQVSPDQRLLAYSTDTTGSEYYTIQIKDLETGDLLPDQIPKTSYAVEWANDNRTIFYTVQDDTWRSYKLFRHPIGTDVADDELLYHEEDALFSVYLSKTKDKKYLILTLMSIESSEEHFLDADTPEGSFTLMHPRQPRIRYHLDHHQGTFYIQTNEEAPNYKIMRVPVDDPGKEKWQTFIPHDKNRYLDGVELFDKYLVIYGRQNGLQTLQIHTFQDGKTRELTFPEPVYAYAQGDNPEPHSRALRFTYQSLTTADSVFDVNMDTLEWELQKQEPVLGGYDARDYQSERIFAPAADGTQIPVSLVYRKGMVRDGNTPCLLYGYGSYGASMNPVFNASRLSLLDRGFIFAIAHIRGGREMGRYWYDQGKWLHKKNTFTDFIDCARHLIAEKYTSTPKLAIMGRSAGGLLMGAVLTMAPELFHAAVAAVPFVDVVTTMLDDAIPLTVGEYDEWGNPNLKEYYDYMLSYSPYDNTTAKAFPHILITAGLNDPRVQYWEPAKWTAKLRAVKTDDNRLLLKTHMGAGHFSSSGRYDYLKDTAFEFAFILDVLGMKE